VAWYRRRFVVSALTLAIVMPLATIDLAGDYLCVTAVTSKTERSLIRLPKSLAGGFWCGARLWSMYSGPNMVMCSAGLTQLRVSRGS